MFSVACVRELFSVHAAACFAAVNEWDGVAALQKLQKNLCYHGHHLLLLQNAHTLHILYIHIFYEVILDFLKK